MSTKPVPPDERARIVQALRDGQSANSVAREFGRGIGTVSRIAADAGVSLDRSKTKDATAAAEADAASIRAALRRRLLNEATQLLDELHQPHQVIGFSAGQALTVDVDSPVPSDKRSLMTAAAIAIDKSLALDRHDNDQGGLAAVDAWLRGVTEEAVRGA